MKLIERLFVSAVAMARSSKLRTHARSLGAHITRFAASHPCRNRRADFFRAACEAPESGRLWPTCRQHLAEYRFERPRRNSKLGKSGHIERSDIIDLHQLDLVAGDRRV